MDVLRRIGRHHLAIGGLVILVPMFLCAIFAPLIAPHDPLEPDLKNILSGDFLEMDLNHYFPGSMAITGNFPYNISAQILFKVLYQRDKVIEVTGMLQKEVAERICSGPGSKVYGILSVLLQAFYDTEYLFTVPEHVFMPPPKVKSGVIRLRRNGSRTARPRSFHPKKWLTTPG